MEASSSAAPRSSVAKKRQRTKRDVDFKLSFTSPQTLRLLFTMIADVLPEISVEVINTKSFKGISICNVDEKKVCVVQARLQCDVQLSSGADNYFTISVSTLCTCMRTVAPHYLMEMTKYANSDDIEIESTDQMTGVKVNSCRMATLCKDFSKAAMSKLQYDFNVQIDLNTFRSIVKISKDLHAETIGFEIRQAEEGRITFCLRAEGDASHEHYFPSSTKGEEGESTFVTALEETQPDVDVASQPIIYQDHFSATYLNTFLKSMERQVLTVRIACADAETNEGGTRSGSPLVLMYPLGAEKSYVCFVLAPKQTE